MAYMTSHHGISQRRACRLIRQPRSNQSYRSRKDPRTDLRQRMREIASTRVRCGYRRVHILLKREGWQLGRSQAYRLYSEEQLQLRSKLPRRRKRVVQRRQRIESRKAGDAWTMDFVADEFGRGGKFRILTVVDVPSRARRWRRKRGSSSKERTWSKFSIAWLRGTGHPGTSSSTTAASSRDA